MATWADVERTALALPGASRGTAWNRPTVEVNGRWFVLDRDARPDAVDPDTGERWQDLIVLYVEDEETKLRLAADDSGYFLTTPHFDRSPRMILAHLDRIDLESLREAILDSWLARAPRRLVAAHADDIAAQMRGDGAAVADTAVDETDVSETAGEDTAGGST